MIKISRIWLSSGCLPCRETTVTKMAKKLSTAFTPKRKLCRSSHQNVTIEISKSLCLMDEKVEIKVKGLQSGDKVTVLATTKQDTVYFWSYGNFLANQDGCVNLSTDKPLDGSYKDLDPMGLFWSLKVAPWQPEGQRMHTMKAIQPRRYRISVFPVTTDPSQHITSDDGCLASIEHHRSYIAQGVRRVPVNHPLIQGTVFIPEGRGPFPGVIDIFGGLITLMESRAALMASHGFTTFALSYLHGKGLPQQLQDIDTKYFEEAVKWFAGQQYVQEDGIGVLGLCLGGSVAFWMTENLPQVQATANLNGVPFPLATWSHDGDYNYIKSGSVDLDKLWTTDEGVVLKDAFICDPDHFYKPWRHGAKLLICLSGDDFMTRMDYLTRFYDQVPEQYRSNISLEYYPGSGHLLEPPYTPVIRSVTVKTRMKQLGFPEEVYVESMMCGGYPKPHAAAQEDCWFRCLRFFKENLTKNQQIKETATKSST